MEELLGQPAKTETRKSFALIEKEFENLKLTEYRLKQLNIDIMLEIGKSLSFEEKASELPGGPIIAIAMSSMGNEEDQEKIDEKDDKKAYIAFDSFQPLYKVLSKHAKMALMKDPPSKPMNEKQDEEQEINLFHQLRTRITRIRRSACLLQDTDTYRLCLLQELSLESEAYEKVMNHAQSKLKFTNKQYQQSMYRYQFDRKKSDSLKGELQKITMLIKQMELNAKKHKTNRNVLSRAQCIEALSFVEGRRQDTLADMSDPFKKGARERSEVVLELQLSQHKTNDQLYFKYGVEPLEFEIDCRSYDLVKGPEDPVNISRNAMVIANNIIQ